MCRNISRMNVKYIHNIFQTYKLVQWFEGSKQRYNGIKDIKIHKIVSFALDAKESKEFPFKFLKLISSKASVTYFSNRCRIRDYFEFH